MIGAQKESEMAGRDVSYSAKETLLASMRVYEIT